MGGGVIIKPVLDFLGFHSLNSIAFYSSVAVFVMSISSTYKQYQNGVQIEWKKAASISFGSLVGGMLGDLLLNQAIALAPNEESTTNPIYHHVADLGFGSSLQSIFQLALTPQRIEHFSDCRIRLRDSINLFRHRWRSH
ncbi:hypothetical protein EfsSVR2332_08390 [Enterococcus faecalis]|uniref:Uncharacterized protein n=1 Tax=Enterococcus faecalis TaxID=1351 RepID=A0AC59HM36_ENTFL|nr:hypothetical protein EfsSVR2332_08390 [Enterococcus faecalis]